jgi:hypothetical protein
MSAYFAAAWGGTSESDSNADEWQSLAWEAQAGCDRVSEAGVTVVAVDGGTFQSLLISNRNLERWDSPDQNTFGLFDPQQRIRYVIGQSELFELQR